MIFIYRSRVCSIHKVLHSYFFAFWMIRGDCIGIPCLYCFPLGECIKRCWRLSRCLQLTSVHSMQVLCPYIYAPSKIFYICVSVEPSRKITDGGKSIVSWLVRFLFICAGMTLINEIPVASVSLNRSAIGWSSSIAAYAEFIIIPWQ